MTNENMYESPASNLVSESNVSEGRAICGREVELTWGNATKIWWSFLWRTMLISVLAGFVLGGIGGGIAGAVGHLDKAAIAGGIAGYVGGIFSTLIGVKLALAVKYSKFRVVLLTKDT